MNNTQIELKRIFGGTILGIYVVIFLFIFFASYYEAFFNCNPLKDVGNDFNLVHCTTLLQKLTYPFMFLLSFFIFPSFITIFILSYFVVIPYSLKLAKS